MLKLTNRRNRMKKPNARGFAVVEVLVVVIVLVVIIGVGLLVFSRMNNTSGSPEQVAKDAVVSENLQKAKQELGERVSTDKTIPSDLKEYESISYSRKDNQKAELCATFLAARTGTVEPKVSFWDKLLGKSVKVDSTHQIYRDNVDFGRHAVGRNCYVIDYAPINEAYDKKYEGIKKNHKVCDSLRQYHSKFTGQTIKGFFIGGSFTTNPGTAGGRAVLAQDADAFDNTCKKIPISELKVGDKVEMFIEDGPVNGGEKTYFVKAIKKDF